MSETHLLSFAVIVFLLVVSPGPNGLLIAKTVPSLGKRAGIYNVAGFIAAFYIHGALSVLGISVLLTKSAEVFTFVKVLGALYLTWIGIKSLINAYAKQTVLPEQLGAAKNASNKQLFLEGLLTNLLNPKVSMFYLAAFPQFIPLGENALIYGLLLVSIHALINLLWFSSLVVMFAHLASFAKGGAFTRILKAVTGCVFLAFGAKLLTLERN